MIAYDKQTIRENLTTDNIFELLNEFGGNPTYFNTGLISDTICHNLPGVGSHKLYYYNNSHLFRCYTGGCEEPIFDIFELVIKVMKIQYHKEYDLNQAVRFVANKFNLYTELNNNDNEYKLEDWEILDNYDRIQDISEEKYIILKEYDKSILNKFNYTVKITPWLNEYISQDVINKAQIGYYPGKEQITIPHFDQNGRFIGLRGRTLIQDDAELYGKYRPIKVNNQLYNHPLGMNLYNLNNSEDAISFFKKAIVFESEKSVLKYASYFGWDNNISVACCGSNLSAYQVQLLLDSHINEIIIAFDRQFQSIGDNEFIQWKKKMLQLNIKYHKYAKISCIWDKNMITDYKSSPIDEGKDKFWKLFSERIVL